MPLRRPVAMTTVEALLQSSALPRNEASALLAHALQCERAWLVAHSQDALADAQRLRAEALFARRRAGEPVAYLLGEREFWGLALQVSPAVLIPRPETERLVELALERIPAQRALRVLDAGTGTGAIAIAIAVERPLARITAIDASADALAIAEANARRHRKDMRFLRSDWFAALAAEQFDLIVSNPPYIASADRHLAEGDLRFEPRAALDAGPSGMEAIAALAEAALRHLAPGGWLLIEHGWDQRDTCLSLLAGLGYARVADFDDLAGVPRVIVGQHQAE